MSHSRLQPFFIVKNGQVQSTALLDPTALPSNLPPGVSLLTQASAAIQGLTQGGADDDTARAQAAVALDFLAYKRSSAVADNADTIAGGSGTPTLAQLTATVRLLASWISMLARHDVMVQRELIALILRDPADFGAIGAPPAAVTIAPTPAEATASGGQLTS